MKGLKPASDLKITIKPNAEHKVKSTPLVEGRAKTIFEDIYFAYVQELKTKGIIEIDDLIKITKMMQQFEMDCHIVVAGQNGYGKSNLLIAIMKRYLGQKWFDNLMLAKHTVNDIVQFVLHKESTLCGIDEWNQYLNYTKHAESDQKHLITTLELARSKSIGFIGCIRDPRKITLNYRDGKMSVVVWIVDRFVDGGSYAAVFITNPAIESYDRFGFESIPGDIVDFDEMRAAFEDCPSFIGYLNMSNISKYLDKGEIKHYKDEKILAMAYAHLNHLMGEFAKKKMDAREYIEQLNLLRDILPAEDIDKAMPRGKQATMTKWVDD